MAPLRHGLHAAPAERPARAAVLRCMADPCAFALVLTKILPDLAGGLTIALARSFNIFEPGRRNPATADGDRAFALFDPLI